jgi:hypothetical protein
MTTRLRSAWLHSAAAIVFLAACALIRGGLVRDERFGDVELYQRFARQMLDGQVPYRDFFVEYPPGSLLSFIVPGLISTAHFLVVFKSLMALCGVATLLLAARIAERRTVLLVTMALSPLAIGPLALDEYDLWPTLVTVGALVALVRGRDRLGCGLLGLGAATKIFPAAILPAALVWIYRRSGARACAYAFAAFCGVAGIVYGAFALVAPGGVWYSIEVQARRGLQKESLGSAVLYVLDQLGLYAAHIHQTNARWTQLTGPAGDTLATASTVAQLGAAILAAVLVARRAPDARTLLCAAAAAVAGFVAFGKVFSPQYLIWLVPLVPLAGGLVEVALLGAALVLTQLWFLGLVTPFDLDGGVWLLVLRDLLVVALFARFVLRLRGPRTARRAAGSEPARPTPATPGPAAP